MKQKALLRRRFSTLAFADHRHDLEACNSPARPLEALESRPRSDQPPDPAVILFNDIVQALALLQRGEAPECAVLLPHSLFEGSDDSARPQAAPYRRLQY